MKCLQEENPAQRTSRTPWNKKCLTIFCPVLSSTLVKNLKDYIYPGVVEGFKNKESKGVPCPSSQKIGRTGDQRRFCPPSLSHTLKY